ncbi:MAG: ATP-binding protein [Chloroflexaceae bacterium]|nr:ATP-binding protein [Chloroflexaceae bacterium]
MNSNPFTERGRITATERFIGRWRELSVVFDRLEQGRPVLIDGAAGIGKSSLLTHIAQSAAVNLERPDLSTCYLDLASLESAEELYETLARAVGSRAHSVGALEIALLQNDGPLLLCLDRCEVAVAAGWGAAVLDELARLSLRSAAPPTARPIPALDGVPLVPALPTADLLLVGVLAGRAAATPLNAPFARISLGGFAPTEVRLLTDAYLDPSGVRFTAADLRELSNLSLNHPAYLQRAAYHLFIARNGNPAYDWRAAYLAEAAERPISGAPLPPGVFIGEPPVFSWSSFAGEYGGQQPRIEVPQLGDLADLGRLLGPAIGGLLAWQVAGNLWLGGLVAGLLALGVWLLSRSSR